jgi:hypothetical protein
VNPKHYLEIEKFHFKSELSSEKELEPSTAQHPQEESQKVPNIEQIEEPEPEPNSVPREETKPQMPDRGTPAAESISKPKWATLHMYTGEGKDRNS